MMDIVETVKNPSSSRLPAPQAELLASWDMDLLIRDLKNALPAAIWNDPEAFSYNRKFRAENLKDGCAKCAFGKICRGGCKSLAFATTGDVVSNPYCLQLQS